MDKLVFITGATNIQVSS